MKQAYAVSPPELSPAAQAVLDAFRSSHTGQGCLAAALKAAADHASQRLHTTPSMSWGKGWKEGMRRCRQRPLMPSPPS
jgi:hypothetical protein